ncbi:hypothetical protein EON64_13925, partial [archaeon]
MQASVPTSHCLTVRLLRGHAGAVSALGFQGDGSALFSGSLDRTVKQWDVGTLACMETLFGHQDAVLSLDCWQDARPLTG